jgi:hypothetical protein
MKMNLKTLGVIIVLLFVCQQISKKEPMCGMCGV